MLTPTALRITGTGLLCAALAGCATFRKLREEVGVLNEDYRLTGKVTNLSGDPSRVYIGVWKQGTDRPGEVEIVEVVSPNAEGIFAMFLPAGSDYYALAGEDLDGNDRWDEGEPLWYFGKPDPLVLSRGESLHLEISLSRDLDASPLPRQALTRARAGRELVELSSGEQVKVVLGDIADFDSPEFSAEMERQGLWEPATFLKQRGFGIYFIEAYDPKKRPVLFVSGCGGSPQTWRYIVGKLDRSKYQAWIWVAPSGLRLEDSAHGLNSVVKLLHQRHQFSRMDVVAYSMGGLTTRRFLQMNLIEDGNDYIKKFISISTPWGGHEMAEMGVERAPTAIPAWYDIRTNSPFIQGLYKDDLPLEHYLLYSTQGKRSPFLPPNNDGTVSINSETDPRATAKANQVVAHDLTHTTIVTAPEVAEEVENFLDDGVLQRLPNPFSRFIGR